MAGFVGSLTGLGGGIVIIPLLTLVFGVDIRYAIGTALVTSIATSSGAAAAYVRERITNIRIGMFLETATTAGAALGAFVAVWLDRRWLALLFGGALIFSAVRMVAKHNGSDVVADNVGSPLAARLRLNGACPDNGAVREYRVQHVAAGYAIMVVAGMMSGLLGIGSGACKVLAMDNVMRIPFKVSTTTSNFMVGVTAAASAVVYFQRGYIDPGLAMPVVIGVLLGAFAGSALLPRMKVRVLKLFFSFVILCVAAFMIYSNLVIKQV
jgi:uncharacterized membrane protein YfcA